MERIQKNSQHRRGQNCVKMKRNWERRKEINCEDDESSTRKKNEA